MHCVFKVSEVKCTMVACECIPVLSVLLPRPTFSLFLPSRDECWRHSTPYSTPDIYTCMIDCERKGGGREGKRGRGREGGREGEGERERERKESRGLR